MIQALSCAIFEELYKGKLVTYEVMCTQDFHEYEQIFNYNYWSPYEKVKTSNEDARLPQEYMSTIDSLVDNKIKVLKYSTKGGNGGVGRHQNLNN